MKIKSAEFVISNTDVKLCPKPNMPEYAFIGRSNVGKSSLINMLCDRKKLAKTSARPGKTQLINHFLINDNWYIVDLPGYGYAQVSKIQRAKWEKFIRKYLTTRQNLMTVFVLIDVRIEAQKNDLEFMEFLGKSQISFSMVFTKSDGVSGSKLDKNLAAYRKEMFKTWEELPPSFITSSALGNGRDELLNYIEEINGMFDASLVSDTPK